MRSTVLRRLAVAALVMTTLVGGAMLATAEEEPTVGTETDARASSGDTDMVAHGTAWVAERPGKFKNSGWKPFGWGTWTRRKAAGNEWMHISIPYISRLEGDRTYVKYVEFCGESTNGAVTKPIRIDVWDNNTRIASQAVAWVANNNYQCHGVVINPAVAAQSLSVSVRVHYDNAVDQVTMFKAWAKASS